jgi:hypothetical protein
MYLAGASPLGTTNHKRKHHLSRVVFLCSGLEGHRVRNRNRNPEA